MPRARKLALLLACIPISLFAQAPVPSGTGLYVAPTSAAYADLTNAARAILADLQSNFPTAQTYIIYDQQTFAAIPYYESALNLVRNSLKKIWLAEGKSCGLRSNALDLTGLGTAASGLASLIAVTLPSYAIQGQSVTLDTSALIAAFAAAASSSVPPRTVILPAYLLPATASGRPLQSCNEFDASDSLADLWSAAATEASNAQLLPAATKDPLKTALDDYQKLRDVFLASDKGVPLLGKLLIVEGLAKLIVNPAQLAVVDMKLDAVGIDSTTRSVLWWRTTRFSANVMAHYSLLSVQGSGHGFALALKKPGYVNIVTQNVDPKRFSSSVAPAGKIN